MSSLKRNSSEQVLSAMELADCGGKQAVRQRRNSYDGASSESSFNLSELSVSLSEADNGDVLTGNVFTVYLGQTMMIWCVVKRVDPYKTEL